MSKLSDTLRYYATHPEATIDGDILIAAANRIEDLEIEEKVAAELNDWEIQKAEEEQA